MIEMLREKKMKKIVFLLFFCLVGVGFAQAAVQNDTLAGKKILIAYFSWSGNTEHLAKIIQSQLSGGNTGADMFKIETAEPYPDDYNELAYGVGKKQS